MDTIKFNREKEYGKFKVLNATNGGPWHKRHAIDQYCSNFEDYKAARIPYSRNHDSAFHTIYGGRYAHDISNIFPNFDADPYDPASYEFACTDESILVTLEAGTETFFRLGQSIEHQIKKYFIFPPKDFNKWAVICEHIIMHYNEGWANGFNLGIKYWEIWNEPDLDSEDSPPEKKRTWAGTQKEFFDLYEITAKHLKSRFPNCKIGGPAISGNLVWAEAFLAEMSKRQVPIDFFSWHVYAKTTQKLYDRSERVHELLEKYGYGNAESILNEWNYVRGWVEDFIYSIKTVRSMKGAAFTMACISVAQPSTIDMLMYYDTRPSGFCGAFNPNTYERFKGYYPLAWYGQFYDLKCEIRAENAIDDVYTLCGKSRDGKLTAVITYYTENDDLEPVIDKTFRVDLGGSKYELYLLDETHDGDLIGETDDVVLTMKPNTCILIKEK